MIYIYKYERTGKNIEIGFLKENFIVYADVEEDKNLSKHRLLQKAYENCKNSIDYETELFNNGEKNSIIAKDADINNLEEFTPDVSSPKRIDIITDKTFISFGKDVESIDVNIDVKVVDQYNEDMDLMPTLKSDYGTIENNVLSINKPEVFTKAIIIAELRDISKTVEISIEPYNESIEEEKNINLQMMDTLVNQQLDIELLKGGVI